jgi:hypothetical protein
LARGLRARAACVLWAELLLRAALAPAALVLAYLVLALFGLGNGWVFLVVLLAALGGLAWEARRIVPPSRAAVDRRIEAASGLRHQPLAALADAPATGGELAAEIWRLHQARMAAALTGARAGWPAPLAAARDPVCLRALLLLLLATGLVVAGPDAPARLGAALALPAWPFAGPVLNVWVTPPAYTGQAPQMLSPGQNVTTLAGAKLTVILDGSADDVRLAGAVLPATDLGPQSRRVDAVIHASGRLVIGPWWLHLAQWRITVVQPSSPRIALLPVTAGQSDLRLNWNGSDAYGLAVLSASIQPPGFPQALPETAALPAKTGPGAARLAVADSPFAGMQAGVTLHAQNLAGLGAASATQTVMMPPALYKDPTALALSVLRRNLALVPGRAPAVAARMMQLAQGPPSAISYAADLQLAMLATALGLHATTPQGAVTRMLALIKQIEAGPDYGPAQALAQANQALLAALAHGPPDADTLNKLLAAMQQALAQHLGAIAPAPSGGPLRRFDPSALNRLAAKIAADEQAGRTAQAQAELRQLQSMLQALQNARPMSAAQAAQAQAASQAAQGLSQLMQNEASLLNQTGQGSATPQQQGALQQTLNSLRGALAKAGLPDLPGLGQAGQAMKAAHGALSRQDSAAAQTAEIQALQGLQKAAAALQNAMQQEMEIGQGGQAPSQTPQGSDPNGIGDDYSLPGLNLPSSNPANAIQQQIIHDDANPGLPPATHEYLRRLLDTGQ